jgi:tetratricopeptide (TPR) repeat protein
VAAEIMQRASAPAGSVIQRKSGEEVLFVDLPPWRNVEVKQDLLPGDILRTNVNGHLAVLFADNTQIRMARNTTLLVKQVGAAEDTVLGLQAGAIWARAERGGQGLTVETPAAAAAIRGTDWTLTVEGSKTSLAVFEGTVELSNAQGSVTVHQGEGAIAYIGKTPTKYTLVNLKEREQVLLYGELRSAFSYLPVTGNIALPQARRERERVLAIAASSRSAADWLSLAETSLAIDGRAAAIEALSHLHRPLPRPLEARALLVEAMIAGQERRYREAAVLFGRAEAGLPRDRRATAAYGKWFAESLADPDRPRQPPPAGAFSDDPAAWLARATAANFVLGPAAAIDILREAEKRFPHDASLPAARADLAYELDRRDEVKEALARANAIDPDDPTAMLVEARYRSTVFSDLDGALAILNRAVAVTPGADAIWNEIGIVQSDRNASIEADAAYRKSIELNPENAALYANYARFLMDYDQMEAAKAALDKAEALDATGYAVLAAKGRYLMRMGKRDEAEQTLLAASAVNPTYGDGLIGLAIVAYQQGATEEAEQALDNAARFDPEDPSPALIRSAIALDSYRADDAILEARQALAKRQARGGHYAGFDANRQTTSFAGVALDFLGLDEWGAYYADRGYDPFLGSTYIDEATIGRVNPFVGNPALTAPDDRIQPGSNSLVSQFQGFLLDPLSIAASNKRNTLERTAFFEVEGGGGFLSEEGSTGGQGSFLVQGTGYLPLPYSFAVQGDVLRPEFTRDNDRADITAGSFNLGFHPTLADRMLLFGDKATVDTGFPGQTFDPTPFDNTHDEISNLGAGWSHTFAERNVLQAFVVGSRTDSDRQVDLVDDFGPFRENVSSTENRLTGGIGHMVGIGPATLRYGFEAGSFDLDQTVVDTDLISNLVFFTGTFPSNGQAYRAYADALVEVTPELQIQGGLYPTWLESEDDTDYHLNPRIGVGYSPIETQWLRGFYREDTQFPSNYTLSPVSTLGLQPLDLPLAIGGLTKTAGAQWDAEWSERFFTSFSYQHQTFDGISLDIPKLLGTFDTTDGIIDRVSASANIWIGGGVGAFGNVAWNWTEDQTPGVAPGQDLPLIPDYLAQVGLTYVSPWRFKVTVAETFVGKRLASPLAEPLEPYQTTDAAFNWKSESGGLEFDLKVLNIFDTDFDLANFVPGPGRTISGRLRARF